MAKLIKFEDETAGGKKTGHYIQLENGMNIGNSFCSEMIFQPYHKSSSGLIVQFERTYESTKKEDTKNTEIKVHEIRMHPAYFGLFGYVDTGWDGFKGSQNTNQVHPSGIVYIDTSELHEKTLPYLNNITEQGNNFSNYKHEEFLNTSLSFFNENEKEIQEVLKSITDRFLERVDVETKKKIYVI